MLLGTPVPLWAALLLCIIQIGSDQPHPLCTRFATIHCFDKSHQHSRTNCFQGRHNWCNPYCCILQSTPLSCLCHRDTIRSPPQWWNKQDFHQWSTLPRNICCLCQTRQCCNLKYCQVLAAERKWLLPELKRVEVQQGERRTSDEVEDDGVINATELKRVDVWYRYRSSGRTVKLNANRVEASRCFVSIPEQWENS